MSYLGSLVQFSPATGRAGRCRQTSLCVGSTHPDIAVCGEHSSCSSHTGFSPYRGVSAFPVYTAQAPGCSIWSGPCVECGSSFQVLHKSVALVAPTFCVFPALSSSGSQGLLHSKGNYKQGEKTALRLGENNSKRSNRQRINLKNIQATLPAQVQKNK